jgi:hypothetical protein
VKKKGWEFPVSRREEAKALPARKSRRKEGRYERRAGLHPKAFCRAIAIDVDCYLKGRVAVALGARQRRLLMAIKATAEVASELLGGTK